MDTCALSVKPRRYSKNMEIEVGGLLSRVSDLYSHFDYLGVKFYNTMLIDKALLKLKS
jgi:hypothetical protein